MRPCFYAQPISGFHYEALTNEMQFSPGLVRDRTLGWARFFALDCVQPNQERSLVIVSQTASWHGAML